jgi:hypothetical protein
MKIAPLVFHHLFSFRTSFLLFSHHRQHLDLLLLSQSQLRPFCPLQLGFSLPLLSLSSFQPLLLFWTLRLSLISLM